MTQEEINTNMKPTKASEHIKKKAHQWLSSSSLKGETEGFILAAQDQSISARVYQTKILKNVADPNCRL